MLEVWRKHALFSWAETGPPELGLCFVHMTLAMETMVSGTGCLSVQIKEPVWWQWGDNFHLIRFNLIPCPSHPSIPNWRKSKVKQALHVSFCILYCFSFVVALLPSVPSAGPLNFVRTLTLQWLLLRHFVLGFSQNLPLTSWLTMKQLFDPFICPCGVLLPYRSWNFTTWSKQPDVSSSQANFFMSGSPDHMAVTKCIGVKGFWTITRGNDDEVKLHF